ncbi:MAG: hypothetical protein WBP94_15210 [Rhodomicrobiaceae bacterium]
MKQIIDARAAVLGLALAIAVPFSSASAETQVLESSVPEIAVGSTLKDHARVNIPDGGTVRVLIVSTGATKTLKGPYEGTIETYKDDRSWWERLMGRHKDTDAPIGATRGLRQEP